MPLAQFLHERAPHLRAALLQQLRPDAEFLAHRQVFASPDRHLRQHRQQLDALLGQAVDRLLQMRRVVGLGDDPLREQHPQPIGEDIGGNALLRPQQLAVVPLVAEHHVANDQQAPLVAHHLEREIDRAPGSVIVAHPSAPRKTACNIASLCALYNRLRNATANNGRLLLEQVGVLTGIVGRILRPLPPAL
jgi:hypothetical protein